MSVKTVQTLKGFRDFLPREALKRSAVIDVVKKTFALYGFEPLETPALEYADLLMGKYGEEADKLVYNFEDRGGRQIGLKYDQTVPTARVIAQNWQQLPMPFRRYQIQPAWRAENTQAGRYREFLQCDVDIFGVSTPLADSEIITTAVAVLANLGLVDYQILVNDRQILFELMSQAQIPEPIQSSVIQTIDKLDKKSELDVREELKTKGLSEEAIEKLFQFLAQVGPNENLSQVISLAIRLGIPENKIKFSPSLARGLDYYTGTIFEIKLEGYDSGSVAGGGRYDNLIESLSGVSIPAVGIAFGFDRIMEAIEQKKIPVFENNNTVLVTIFDPSLESDSLNIAKILRQNIISAEIYPDPNAKIDKQLKYADKKEIQYAVILGPEEKEKKLVTLKDLKTGEQEELSVEKAIEKLK